MKYQLVAENQAEQDALGENPAARTLFDPFLPVLGARAIITAADLGLFEALAEKPLGIENLAQAVAIDPQALSLLLRVLTCAGYVNHESGKYDLTELSRFTLLNTSPAKLSSWVKFCRMQWDMISQMENALKTGKPVDSDTIFKSAGDWRIQQEAMLETAKPIAGWIAGQVPVQEKATRLLDLGGSHGYYGAMICKANPHMTAEVLDLSDVVKIAEDIARQEGIDGIVTHRKADILTESLGSEIADVIFMGNITHHLSPEQNRDLIKRAAGSLRPDGTIAIWDIRPTAPDSPPDLVADSFALFFRVTSKARCYTASEFAEWLKEAGLGDITNHGSPTPSHVLITARKP